MCLLCGSNHVAGPDEQHGVSVCRVCGAWWGGNSLPFDPDDRDCQIVAAINRGAIPVRVDSVKYPEVPV